VRAHYHGEPAPDLAALIKAETGRDVAIDQGEIMDIVLGKRFWPGTFDFAEVRRIHTEMSAKAQAALSATAGPAPVDRCLDALIEAARAWVAASGTASRKQSERKPAPRG